MLGKETTSFLYVQMIFYESKVGTKKMHNLSLQRSPQSRRVLQKVCKSIFSGNGTFKKSQTICIKVLHKVKLFAKPYFFHSFWYLGPIPLILRRQNRTVHQKQPSKNGTGKIFQSKNIPGDKMVHLKTQHQK